MSKLFSNNYREEFDYLLLNQPKPSTIKLEDNFYFSYQKSPCSSGCFTWTQPLQFSVKENKKQWNRLIIENNQNSDVLNHVQNSNCNTCFKEIIDECFCVKVETLDNLCSSDQCFSKKYKFLPTEEESNIEFYTDFFETPLEVFYLAKKKFSTSVKLFYYLLLDESFFKTPYNLLDSQYYLNLNNDSEWIKIAFAVNSNSLKTKRDVGYFTPNNLNLGKIYSNSQTFIKSQSANEGIQRTDLVCLSGNKIEKFNLCSDQAIGLNQEGFMPFISNNEEFQIKQVNCEDSFYVKKSISGDVFKYQEDVYGNQYFLYKDLISDNNIYEKFQMLGDIWIKPIGSNTGTHILNYTNILRKYKKYFFESGLYDELINQGIRDFAVFYDTVFIKLCNSFILEKIYFDYDELKLYSTDDDSYFSAGIQAEALLDEDRKRVYFTYINNGMLYLGQYNLNSPKLCGDFSDDYTCENEEKITTFNSNLKILTVFLKGVITLKVLQFKVLSDKFELTNAVAINDIQDLNLYKMLKAQHLDTNDYLMIFENSFGQVFPIRLNTNNE